MAVFTSFLAKGEDCKISFDRDEKDISDIGLNYVFHGRGANGQAGLFMGAYGKLFNETVNFFCSNGI